MSRVVERGSEPELSQSGDDPNRRRLRPGWPPRAPRPDGVAAVATWAVSLVLAAVLVHEADLNPFTYSGALMPAGVGAAVGALLLVLVGRRPTSELLAGVTLGAYAGWVGLVMLSALHGTPYGYDGLSSDEGRLVAQAMKYMSSWRAVDAFVHNLPTEYPPLFPWAVGHFSSAVGRPAWRVIGDAQVALMSGTPVLGYLLWRRLLGAWPAFLIPVLALVMPTGEHFGDAAKVYEVVVLVVIVPWILATFLGLPRERGGLHWLPGGVIGGLVVLTYPGYLVFALLGVLAIAVLTWWAAGPGRAYLLHLVGVTATAFVVASWYVVPFVARALTKGSNPLSDLYRAPSVVASPVPLPFLQVTPLGLIELVGLFGLVWLWRREWWAQPLALLVAGTYVYRGLFLLVMAFNGHSGYFEYVDRLTQAGLIAAGVMTLARALPALGARWSWPIGRQHAVSALAAVVVVAWAAGQAWTMFTPGPRGFDEQGVGGINYATWAHITALPGGGYPRFAPPALVKHGPVFPVYAVERAVRSTLGPNARPDTLCNTDRLFDFVPYYAYLPRSRLASNSLQRWDDRFASLRTLARISDPAAFAAASQRLPFGRIDVFVLHDGGSKWTWSGKASAVGATKMPVTLAFRPAAFGSGYFRVLHLPARTVVAIRWPQPR